MNTILKIALLTAIPFLALNSCGKDDDGMTGDNSKSITVLVSENPNLSLLKAAVIRAGLAETLSAKGTFTIFAPDNSAFQAAGLGTEAAINAVAAEDLKKIILYHALPEKYASGTIPSATTELNTVAGIKTYVTKNSGGVFVNSAKVTTADVNANNGVVHVINKVLMPPSANIVQAAQANSNLSFLVAAVTRASTGSTNVAAALSAAGPLTVFAPTNAAFQAAGFATIADIQAANANTLAGILTYHVIAARVFSSDLTEGAMPTTLNGGKLTITLAGGAKVKGTGNTTASAITATDMVTTNGVVHVIDRVLMP